MRSKIQLIIFCAIAFIVTTRFSLSMDGESSLDDYAPQKKLLSLFFRPNSSSLTTAHQKIAKDLFKNEDEKKREIGRQVLYDVVTYPNKYYYSDTPWQDYEGQLLLQLDTVNILMTGNAEDQQKALKAIDSTFASAKGILNFGPEEKNQRILLLMATYSNPLQLKALETLQRYGDEECKKKAADLAMSRRLNLARIGDCQSVKELCKIVKEYRTSNARYIYRAGEYYLQTYGINHDYGRQLTAAAYRLPMSETQSYTHYEVAKEELERIAQQIDHPSQQEAVKFLQDFKDPFGGDPTVKYICWFVCGLGAIYWTISILS